jgi:2-polyprenyl-3-methyl-5-hydroxy-6-metoxy-1,4-benzoquinol methylase
VNFKQRSYQKELLDGEGIPFKDIKRNMQELDLINSLLGGHKITVRGIETLISIAKDKKSDYNIVEIGCGGGDNLRVVKKWAEGKGIKAQFTGVDINRECIHFAKSQKHNGGIHFICADYKDAIFEQKPHIIFSSLFCHHFTDDELVKMLQWKYQNSTIGFFINDLQRHPLAFYSIQGLTKIFSKSYLVKNDAPLSVLRGFSKEEWVTLFKRANIPYFHCHWQWAFRWLVTCNK